MPVTPGRPGGFHAWKKLHSPTRLRSRLRAKPPLEADRIPEASWTICEAGATSAFRRFGTPRGIAVRMRRDSLEVCRDRGAVLRRQLGHIPLHSDHRTT